MTQRVYVCLVVLALFLPMPRLGAQQAQIVEPGTRLRVTTLDGVTPDIGTYSRITDATLQLTKGGGSVDVPIGSIRSLEMSRGKKPSVAGGVLGFAIGGLAGGAAGCHFNRDDYGVFCLGQADWKVGLGAAAGGAVSGAASALLFGRERWRPVELRQLRTR